MNRGVAVEFVAPQLINGEEKIIIEKSDVADELTYWENMVILFALEIIEEIMEFCSLTSFVFQ